MLLLSRYSWLHIPSGHFWMVLRISSTSFSLFFECKIIIIIKTSPINRIQAWSTHCKAYKVHMKYNTVYFHLQALQQQNNSPNRCGMKWAPSWTHACCNASVEYVCTHKSQKGSGYYFMNIFIIHPITRSIV